MRSTIRPLWSPLIAGIALGLVLLMTFLITGHGLGASGFFTRLTAWLGGELMRPATVANTYLGPFLKAATGPLANWISWEIVGVLLGALLAAAASGRFRLRLDGATNVGGIEPHRLCDRRRRADRLRRRLARGCTSGIGLSGGAPLAVAAFVFLIGFFIGGIVISYLVRRAWA